MKSKKSILNFFILLIGVIIISPLFFSTPVYAATQTYTLTPSFSNFDNITNKSISIDLATNSSGGDHTTISSMTLSVDINPSVPNYNKIWHVYYKVAGKNYDSWFVPNMTYNASNGIGHISITLPIEYGTVVTGLYPANRSNYDVYSIESYDYSNYTDTLLNSVGLSPFIDVPLTYKGTTQNLKDFNISYYGNRTKDDYIWYESVVWNTQYENIIRIFLPVGLSSSKFHPSKLHLYTYWDASLKPNGGLKELSTNIYYYSMDREGITLYLTLNDFTHWYPDNIACPLIIKFTEDWYFQDARSINFRYLMPSQTDYYLVFNTLLNWSSEKYQQDESINVDNSNEKLSSASDQMIQLEDQLQGDFNNSIGNITVPDNPFSNMGNMFGNSSRFLVHMFNEFTLNHGSPFGSIITFSLLLGLAMLMIGKKGNR